MSRTNVRRWPQRVALLDMFPGGSKGVIPHGSQTADSTDVKLAGCGGPQGTVCEPPYKRHREAIPEVCRIRSTSQRSVAEVDAPSPP